MRPIENLEDELKQFRILTEKEPAICEHAEKLVRGVLEHSKEVDEKIVHYTNNWSLDRLAPVDRNILRLALYEMHFCDDVPPVAAINEAIDIAKSLSTVESGKFVNGILDRAKLDVKRKLR
jgi:N utilization substance protein B